MFGPLLALALTLSAAWACESCSSPTEDIVMTRNVKRMQPDAQDAVSKPRGPLEWGQINFLQTTDTHGWLEGHIKEQNYGADWGDFVSFASHMKQRARELDVDLLLVDTGDLHDGAGLSDITDLNGEVTNPIFENIDYDVLSIGNHELYVTEIARETFKQFAKVYGDRYVTSNVQIKNKQTGDWEYIGKKYRYFTTEKGLRIMAFGVLFDFTSNSEVSKVIPHDVLIKQQWFKDAVHFDQPIDMFLLIGHNPIRPGEESSFQKVQKAIRKMRPNIPIQGFGGHSHIRDFVVYDDKSTGLESGRYCETLGWLAMSGVESPTFNGTMKPKGVPHPTHKAVKNTGDEKRDVEARVASKSDLRFARRYLDWNRLTFAYHAETSQDGTFNTTKGLKVTNSITKHRKELDLTKLFGCAPATWCLSCKPFGHEGNIFTLLTKALAKTVVKPARKEKTRMTIINTGSIRFDLVKGPFTLDDSYIVSPFLDKFRFIPDVPYKYAKKVLKILNNGPNQKRKRDVEADITPRDLGLESAALQSDSCIDPLLMRSMGTPTSNKRSETLGSIVRRQTYEPSPSPNQKTPGYITEDDFGDDGDDTIHTKIPSYPQPNDLLAEANFPADGSDPQKVDLIFLDFIQGYIIDALKDAGVEYKDSDTEFYMPQNFTTNSYLPEYARISPKWQKNVPDCPVGKGIGY